MDWLVRLSRLRRQDAAIDGGTRFRRVLGAVPSSPRDESVRSADRTGFIVRLSTDKSAHRWRLLSEISVAALVQKNLESERQGHCISQTNTMKTTVANPETFESTYALLVRSEETRRSRFETLVYTILIVCTTFAVAQFGHQTFIAPTSVAHVSTALAHHGA